MNLIEHYRNFLRVQLNERTRRVVYGERDALSASSTGEANRMRSSQERHQLTRGARALKRKMRER
jgi:hypothetical protein